MADKTINLTDIEKLLEDAEMDMFCGELYSSANMLKRIIRSDIPEHLKNRIYYQTGILLKKLGDYQDSLSCFDSVINNGGPDEAIIYKASVLNCLGNYREAMVTLSSLQKQYDNELYWETFAVASLETGCPSDSAKALLNLKRTNPENLSLRKLLTIALIRIGNYNGAEREIEEILDIDANDLEANLILTWLSLFSEKEDEAIEKLDFLFEKGNTEPELNFARASINYLAGEDDAARKIMIDGTKKVRFHNNIKDGVTLQIISSAMTSVASENSTIEKELESFKEQVVKSFLSMLTEKNCFLGDKCRQVSETAYLMAKYSEDLSRDEKEDLKIAGAICNLGMIYLPDIIFTKVTPLSSAEKDLIKQHATSTVAILKPFTFFKNIIELIKYHHEKYDGSGYPAKLKGEDIPFGARILAIADFFVDITNDSPRQQGIPPTSAVRTIQTLTGSFFCPKALELLKKVYR